MKLPENFIPTLEKLAHQLYELLPEEARPTSIEGRPTLITEAQMSQDEEIHRVQRFYNMTWLILNEILPDIEKINSEKELKEYLFSKTPLIREQWSHILLDRIARTTQKPIDITSKPLGLIPQNQLKINNINTLFMQLAYNLFYIFGIEIPKQEVCKSSEELGWLYLNKSQSTVEQLKLPVFNYIANFLPEEVEKPIPDKIIGDEKLSPSVEVQFFQRLHNIVCVVANEIFPKLQGKCHSQDDLMSYLVNPSLKKVAHKQVIPLLEATIDAFMDNLYQLLPEKNRPKKVGTIITNTQISQEPFKAHTNLQFIASLYNVVYQIKNSVLPRVKKIDSIELDTIGIAKLVKIGWDFLDEINPLLENLHPILEQLKVIFINDLYAQLTDDQRPSKCGELIPDDKLSKTDPHTFLIQQCYNLACFLLNQLIPEIKKCWTNAGMISLFNDQAENFEKHFKFISDFMMHGSITLSVSKIDTIDAIDLNQTSEVDSDESFVEVEASTSLKITTDESLKTFKEITQPFLNIIEKFLDNISKVVVSLISFVTLLMKETTKFTSLSFTLTNSVNAPLVTGDLSYYAGCYIYETMEALGNSLNTLNDSLQEEPDKNKENEDTLLESKEKQKNIWVIKSYLISPYLLANFYFDNKNHPSDSDTTEKFEEISFLFDQSSSLVTAEAKQIPVKLNELIDEWEELKKEIQKFSNNPNQKPPFITKEAQEIFDKLNELNLQAKVLNKELDQFSIYQLTPIASKYRGINISSILNDIQKKQQDFQEKIAAFSTHLNTLPKTKLIYLSKRGNIKAYNYSELEELLLYYEQKSDEFGKLIQSEAETIQQLKANNLYIKTAYKNLSTSVTQPAQAFLLAEKPNAYQFTYHNQAHQLLVALKKETFAEPTVSSLPHPNAQPEKYQEKIDNAHQNFEATRQELIQNLEQELATQKTYFNQYLNATISQKLADLTQEMPEKKESLINAFKDIEKESGEITYDKTLKDAEDWLAKITIEQLIANALVPLKLTNPDLVKQWVNEFSRAEHQQLSNSLEQFKTPLMQIIETQRVELNAANQKGIEHLEHEVDNCQTKLVFFSETLANLETLKQKQQQEKENLQKNCQTLSESAQEMLKNANKLAAKLQLAPIPLTENIADINLAIERLLNENKEKLVSPDSLVLTEFIPSKNEFIPLSNGKILTALKKQIQDAKTTADIEKIPYCILNSVEEIDQRIGLNLKNLIVSTKKEAFNENKKNAAVAGIELALIGASTPENLHILKLNSHSKLAESAASKLNDATALNELLRALNQEILKQANNAANMLEKLNEKHEASLKATYQKLYENIPEEKWPLSPEIHITALKKTQQLKKLQLELAKIKMALNENHRTLKKVNVSLEKILIPNVTFQQTGALTHEQWEDHHQACTKQLREIQAKYQEDKILFSYTQLDFKYFIQQTLKLSDQIKLLAQITSFEANIGANALLSLKENIQKQGELLNKEYIEITEKFYEQEEKLQKAQQTLVEENQQAQEFNQSLIAVGSIKGQANLKLRQVETRSHPTASKILDGTQKNPSSILAEDQFYEDTNQSIANLTAQLDEFEKSKIQKEAPLSALESAFNQALTAKITAARTAIATLQTSYQDKRQAWESYSTKDLLLQHSRQITNAPKKISHTLANCKGWSLKRIRLAGKDFRDVAMENTKLNNSVLEQCDFSGMPLKHMHFEGANIKTCQFENANFNQVFFDENTQFNWVAYGSKVLWDNFSNPYLAPSEIYSHRLANLVAQKSPATITADLILNLLKQIGGTERPDHITEKAHLIARQNHAISMINHLVPRLTSLDEVLKFRVLVTEKRENEGKCRYDGDFLREELDLLRFKHGNTHPYEQVMTCIQNQVWTLAKNAQLTEPQYQNGKIIMSPHLTHTYGFGFFYTPIVAHQWEEVHKPNTLKPKC